MVMTSSLHESAMRMMFPDPLQGEGMLIHFVPMGISTNKDDINLRLRGELSEALSGKRGICSNNSHKRPLYPRKRGMSMGGRYPDSRLGLLSAPSHSLNHWEQWLRADFPLQRIIRHCRNALETLPFLVVTVYRRVKISAHSCGAVMDFHHFPFIKQTSLKKRSRLHCLYAKSKLSAIVADTDVQLEMYLITNS
jgi:hypothetical protein